MSGDIWQRLEREVKAARTRVRNEVRTQYFESATREPTANVRELIELRRLVDELIDDETIRARELGASWDLLGSSRQQAQQRHKRALARRTQSIPVDEIAMPADAFRQQPLTTSGTGLREERPS
jgi:hypothetical protein